MDSVTIFFIFLPVFLFQLLVTVPFVPYFSTIPSLPLCQTPSPSALWFCVVALDSTMPCYQSRLNQFVVLQPICHMFSHFLLFVEQLRHPVWHGRMVSHYTFCFSLYFLFLTCVATQAPCMTPTEKFCRLASGKTTSSKGTLEVCVDSDARVSVRPLDRTLRYFLILFLLLFFFIYYYLIQRDYYKTRQVNRNITVHQ